VRLITRASEAFLEQVRQVLEESEGERPETIEGLLQERVGVSQSRANLIAVTETNKLNSNINQHRQRAAGLSQYTWSGAIDERERETHVELEGTVQNWNDPPVSEENGDRNHPGEAPRCRCVGIPYIPELEDDAVGPDDGAGAGDDEAAE
jgi:SPP1 gp7 family putative phage head morphogenesis protein